MGVGLKYSRPLARSRLISWLRAIGEHRGEHVALAGKVEDIRSAVAVYCALEITRVITCQQ
jgi:hypothetical protein